MFTCFLEGEDKAQRLRRISQDVCRDEAPLLSRFSCTQLSGIRRVASTASTSTLSLRDDHRLAQQQQQHLVQFVE
jgi:hypothetical protein